MPATEKFDNPYLKENASKNAYNIILELLKKEKSAIKEFYNTPSNK